MRKLASIQKVYDIKDIEGAEKLQVANVLGWKVVIEKGKYTENELVCYFEVDSYLPIRPEFEFLRRNSYKNHAEMGPGFRLHTIRLRGQVSQGLVMKLKDLNLSEVYEEGDDLTELLGVKLWYPVVPACLKGIQKGNFPSFLPKTDEIRVQNLQEVLTKHKGTLCYFTEKLDGTSVTYYLKDGVFGICSRNVELDTTDTENDYSKMAKQFDIENKLRKYTENRSVKNVAIQGEIFGPGIQENRLRVNEKMLKFFNMFDIDRYEYYSYPEFANCMAVMGLETVPILCIDFVLMDDIPTLLKIAEGNSIVNPECLREGIVIRPVLNEVFDMRMAKGMSNGRLSFKAVSQEYLLKHGE